MWDMILRSRPPDSSLCVAVAAMLGVESSDVAVAEWGAPPDTSSPVLLLTTELEGDLTFGVTLVVEPRLVVPEPEWRVRTAVLAGLLGATVYVSNDPDGDPMSLEAFLPGGASQIVELDAQREEVEDRPVYYLLEKA